jgi:hypothetical protein
MNMSYDFAPGVFIGTGIWRGGYTLLWGNTPICWGEYELRIYNGTVGTLRLQDGALAAWWVGTVDLGTRVLILKGATYQP